jgi:hypothetical protein
MTTHTSDSPLRRPCTAFDGTRLIASGPLQQVALKAKALVERHPSSSVWIFDDATGDVIDIDYRGSSRTVLQHIGERLGDPKGAQPEPAAPKGPGRPRLGVVAREVTLLPRHWLWLNGQPGGASVALRRLVDDARRANVGRDRVRRSQEVAYRFMTAMAGNQPGFEEAIRALFRGDRDRFEEHVAGWPADVSAHAKQLAAGAFRR